MGEEMKGFLKGDKVGVYHMRGESIVTYVRYDKMSGLHEVRHDGYSFFVLDKSIFTLRDKQHSKRKIITTPLWYRMDKKEK
jgi:hypothetical protein